MLEMSLNDITSFFGKLIEDVAKRSGVLDSEWKSAPELLGDLAVADNGTYLKLREFLDAYRAWYDVHVEIEESGVAGHLTPEMHSRLMNAIDRRDRTRNELRQALPR